MAQFDYGAAAGGIPLRRALLLGRFWRAGGGGGEREAKRAKGGSNEGNYHEEWHWGRVRN